MRTNWTFPRSYRVSTPCSIPLCSDRSQMILLKAKLTLLVNPLLRTMEKQIGLLKTSLTPPYVIVLERGALRPTICIIRSFGQTVQSPGSPGILLLTCPSLLMNSTVRTRRNLAHEHPECRRSSTCQRREVMSGFGPRCFLILLGACTRG